MTELCEIAIICAGPYGLSIAAHLAAAKIPHRIFGKAMETWATQMPKGMQLKSDGFATSLYDPARRFTFERYCHERNIPYADLGVPPRLEDFINYGRAFQREFVAHIEEVMVERLGQQENHYRLRLETGADCLARTVVVAAGISHFAVLPKVLSGFPKGLVTHTSEHHDLSEFEGKKVAVVGAGASAADVAGLLHEAGVEAHLVARRSQIPFQSKAELPRPLPDRLRRPSTKIGPGWKSVFFTKAPNIFRFIPEARRSRIVRGYLGPAPGYFMRDRVIGKVTLHLDRQVVHAKANEGGVLLTLADKGGETGPLQVDHVICGTGYKSALVRLPFLDEALRSRIHAVDDTPILSANFESSMPGLYFVGAIAANTFGPVLRFACGAEFAAPRVARHLNVRRKHPVSAAVFGSTEPAIAQPARSPAERP